MLKERAHHANGPESSGSLRTSRVKTYKTAAGPLFLRSSCSPSFVEGLKADEGLRALPNIRMDPANILVARLGSRIDGESMNRFFQQLLQSETLPGL